MWNWEIDRSDRPQMVVPNGIFFDFCHGLRLWAPAGKKFFLKVFNAESGDQIFTGEINFTGKVMEFGPKFFAPLAFELFTPGARQPFFRHEQNLKGQPVLVRIPVGTLGDAIAWFSYVERFQRKTGARVAVTMRPELAELFRDQYPRLEFVNAPLPERQWYAMYTLALFFSDVQHQDMPYDCRAVGLLHTAAYILGLSSPDELADEPPRVKLDSSRKITSPYVVIATKGSSQPKYWNNHAGWREVIDWLKQSGFRVLCIDRDHEHGSGVVWNSMPYGAEDLTGDRPLNERIALIKDAACFIGLSSGLSWLAWCCRVPVVLISGFTEPWNEFYTPYRVQNFATCHGCWNDSNVKLDQENFIFCPKQDDFSKKFICTQSITSRHVIKTLLKIPAFQKKDGSK